MWPWLLVAIIGFAIAALVVARRPALRLRGVVLLGAALALALGIELLIQVDVLSVGVGSELMGIALILLAAWAIWRLPRTRHGGPRG